LLRITSGRVVPTEGLEPPHLAAHGPEPCASTNSATWALYCYLHDIAVEAEIIADPLQKSKSCREIPEHGSLGESWPPPLHYARQGVNPIQRRWQTPAPFPAIRTENDLKQPTHTIPSREEILAVFRDAGEALDAQALARA